MVDVKLARCACGKKVSVDGHRNAYWISCVVGEPWCWAGPNRNTIHAAALAWNRVMIAFWAAKGCDPYTGKKKGGKRG